MTSDALVIPMRQSAFDCLLRWALIIGALAIAELILAVLHCFYSRRLAVAATAM
jgi:hypothetical protein